MVGGGVGVGIGVCVGVGGIVGVGVGVGVVFKKGGEEGKFKTKVSTIKQKD